MTDLDRKLTARLQKPPHLTATMGQVSISGGDNVQYCGEYTVTPSTYNAQTLPTANRLLTRNIKVEPIPQWTTSNAAGGETLIIGEESLYGDQ